MEESILQSQENSPKEPQESLPKLPCRNNAIPEWNNAGSDGNVLAYCQRSDILLNNMLRKSDLVSFIQNAREPSKGFLSNTLNTNVIFSSKTE